MLVGNSIQQQETVNTSIPITISVETLAGAGALLTPDLLLVRSTDISLELLTGKASLYDATSSLDYVVLIDGLTSSAVLASPVIISKQQALVTIDALELWGGLQSPDMQPRTNLTILADQLSASCDLVAPPYITGPVIVYPETLIGGAKINKVIFGVLLGGDKPVFYYRDKTGVHPVFSLRE